MINWKALDSLTVADLIGIPYIENGRSLEGVDCYGLAILAVYILKKRKLIDVWYDNHYLQLADEFSPLLNIEKTDSIYKGNLIEMHVNNELHIGVALNGHEMIHATGKYGVKVSPIGAYPIINIYEVI